VLMLEAMAQTAALLAFHALDVMPDENTVYYFAGIDNARFKRPVSPGDQVIMDVTLDRTKAGILKFSATSRVDGQLVCQAGLLCTMRTIA